MPTFDEHIPMENEMIVGITAGMVSSVKGFRLRAEAPEFVPGKKIENQAGSK